MHALRLLGVTDDGTHLVLSDGVTDYALPIDAALRSALRRDTGHPAIPGHPVDERPMSPVEVQALIRGGADAEEAAERAGWTVDKVRRYEGPILAERQHMARLATTARLRPRGPASGSPTLLDRVTRRLAERGVSIEDVDWDSWRGEDGQWIVELYFDEQGRRRRASWTFAKSSMSLAGLDREAALLSDDDPELFDLAHGHDLGDDTVIEDPIGFTSYSPEFGAEPDRQASVGDDAFMSALRSSSRAGTRGRAGVRRGAEPASMRVEEPIRQVDDTDVTAAHALEADARAFVTPTTEDTSATSASVEPAPVAAGVAGEPGREARPSSPAPDEEVEEVVASDSATPPAAPGAPTGVTFPGDPDAPQPGDDGVDSPVVEDAWAGSGDAVAPPAPAASQVSDTPAAVATPASEPTPTSHEEGTPFPADPDEPAPAKVSPSIVTEDADPGATPDPEPARDEAAPAARDAEEDPPRAEAPVTTPAPAPAPARRGAKKTTAGRASATGARKGTSTRRRAQADAQTPAPSDTPTAEAARPTAPPRTRKKTAAAAQRPTAEAPSTAAMSEDASTAATSTSKSSTRRRSRARVPAWDDIMFGARPGGE